MIEKCIALAFSVAIIAQAWGVRRIVGTWLFPACLFGIFWFALTFLPLVVLFTVPIDPLAVGFIFLCALAYSSSSLLFDWRPAFDRNAQKPDAAGIYGSGFLRHAFHASVAASLVLIVVNTLTQGISWFDLVFNLFATAELYATLRYADEITSPLIERWSTVFAYLGVLIGGLRYSCASPGARRRIIALSFLPSVLIAVTQSAKWPFLLSIVLFFGGVLVYRLLSGKLHLIDRDARKAMVMYGSVVLLIVTVSFASRGVYAADDFNIWPMMLSKFASYTSGHLYAFSDWFAFSLGRPSEWTYDREPTSHGFYTFATLFKLMGSSRVLPIGVYDDDYTHAGLIVSNVFTMFRGAIIDFGYAGALVLMAAVGALFHGAFHALLVIRRPVFAVVTFLFMMGFLYSSFVVSLFGSNIVYYVTFGLLWATLWVNQRVAGARAHPPPVHP